MNAEPGHYDDVCERVFHETQAVAVLLIVVGGNRGIGFSVVGVPETVVAVPALLRATADNIEREQRAGKAETTVKA